MAEEENDTTKAIKEVEKEYTEYASKLNAMRPNTKIRKNLDASLENLNNAKKDYIKSLRAFDREGDRLEKKLKKNPEADPTKYEKAMAEYYEAKEQFATSKVKAEELIEGFKQDVGGPVNLFATTEKTSEQSITPTATPKVQLPQRGGMHHGG